jgi:hypothetical protein
MPVPSLDQTAQPAEAVQQLAALALIAGSVTRK